MEPTEDVVACMRREIREEAGIDCEALRLAARSAGRASAPRARTGSASCFCIDRSPASRSENAEGTLEWVEVERVLDLPLWEGDRHFLPLVFATMTAPFHGVMLYKRRPPVSWTYSLV